MSSRLEALPPELRDRVVDYIANPSDLRALCLTSRTLRAHAMPAMYRKVEAKIDVACGLTEDGKTYTGLLSPKHPGLRYLRELRLETRYTGIVVDDAKTVARILKALPKKTLRHFGCKNLMVNEEAIMALFTKQGKLTSLELGPISFNLALFVKSGMLGATQCQTLTALSIPKLLGSATDLDFYQQVIENAPLKSLSIHTKRYYGDTKEATQFNADGGHEELVSTLFSHIANNPSAKPLELETLVMKDFDFHVPKGVLPKYINLCLLQRIELHRCPEAGNFVKILTSKFKKHGTALETFEYVRAEGDTLGSKATEHFLLSFSGLKRLVLIGFDGVDGYQGLDESVLQKHGDTLEELILHPEGFGNLACDEMGVKPDFFVAMAKYCTKLRQLGITMPIIHTQGSTPEETGEYMETFRDIFSLTDLKALRIFNWPYLWPGFFAKVPNGAEDGHIAKLNEVAFCTHMDWYVQKCLVKFFEEFHEGNKSPVFCFAGVDGDHISDGRRTLVYKPTASYVPIKKMDIFDQKQTVLEKVNTSDVKFFEPESGVLSWP
ncbi:hypothetical protein PRZ48_003100 [Zasmidium cellare]|uniref:F-box domain-containing protein n=1 Tax=Zasmidium cellare TaxID=395010 RepID=A0ABR0EU76_ZASCE|nr:hypothetical protein PRZ48_003100 [Zasmidium cellare]